MKLFLVFFTKALQKRDGPTDGRTDGPTDGRTHALDQGRNREIHMGELPFLCTTETAVAVRLSKHH